MYRKDILQRGDEIRTWVNENRSKAWMCAQLKCKPSTLQSAFKELDIIYNGNQGGKKYKTTPAYLPASHYIQTGKEISSSKLKLKLLRDGLKEYKCECCGNTSWLGKPISLELHHIDGDHYNNSWDNIQLLCPNCHASKEHRKGHSD